MDRSQRPSPQSQEYGRSAEQRRQRKNASERARYHALSDKEKRKRNKRFYEVRVKSEAYKTWLVTSREHRSARLKTWRAENLERVLYRSAKERAVKWGLPFTIKLSDIMIPKRCPVFGLRLMHGIGKGRGLKLNSPTLDRINSAKGYVPGNVAVISWRANLIKSVGTAKEHRRIAEWMDAR
jgi:hypothetical protein